MAAAYEWSGTFARARAEVFTSALIFSCVTYWQMDLKKVPGLGFELLVAPSRGTLLLFVASFLVYSSVSMWMRWRIESNALGSPTAIYADVLASLATLRDELSTADISRQASVLKNGVDPLRYLMSEGRLVKTEESGTDQEFLYVAENAKAAKKNPVAAVITRPQKKFDERATEFADVLRDGVERLEALQLRQTTEVATRIAAADAAIGTLRKQIYRLRTLEGSERNLMSFYLPLVASGILVIAALPLALPLMWDSASELWTWALGSISPSLVAPAPSVSGHP